MFRRKTSFLIPRVPTIVIFGAFMQEKILSVIFTLSDIKYGICLLFAVGVSYRSCGYGSEILSRLKELYPAYQIVLDIEAADESAPNLAQRIRRRDFYRRNGYVPTGHYIAYWGMTFEILCSGGDFDLAVYKELVSNIRVEGISFRFFTK